MFPLWVLNTVPEKENLIWELYEKRGSHNPLTLIMLSIIPSCNSSQIVQLAFNLNFDPWYGLTLMKAMSIFIQFLERLNFAITEDDIIFKPLIVSWVSRASHLCWLTIILLSNLLYKCLGFVLQSAANQEHYTIVGFYEIDCSYVPCRKGHPSFKASARVSSFLAVVYFHFTNDFTYYEMIGLWRSSWSSVVEHENSLCEVRLVLEALGISEGNLKGSCLSIHTSFDDFCICIEMETTLLHFYSNPGSV